ncbi:MAG: NAD(P)/FAD-dependent oxidoreductase [Armatimonadota bacterium]
MATKKRPRVIIVGGGFGGLWCARTLYRYPLDILLVNRENYHTFLPLAYQVAAAELETEEVAYPLRTIARKWTNVRFKMATVRNVDLDSRTVQTDDVTLQYDYLILAPGSAEHFSGVTGADEHSFALKTLRHAINLRNHLLCCFERAANREDIGLRQRALTFVIVGGGSTGVEFAGALAELAHGSFARDYPMLDLRQMRIVVLEAGESLLPEMPASGQTYAINRLRKMGIEVSLRSKVILVEPKAVHLADGTVLPTETVIWTAGVRGIPQAREWGLPEARNGRAAVLPTLQVEGHPDAYVIGDLAYFEQDGRPLPMIAPVAIQQGISAAENIGRQVNRQDVQPFRYRDKGSMVAIGRNAAVVRLGGYTIVGFPAWLLWLGVHIFNLIGFRNRLFVLINWARDYFLYERSVRLIIPTESGDCVPDRPDETLGDKR